MPAGPSHGSHSGGHSFGGGGHSFGGGSHHSDRNHSSGNNSLVGGIIGGMIASSIMNRRRQRFQQRYGYTPSDKEFESTPTRQKPTIFITLSIIFAFFLLITFIVFNANKQSLSETNSYIATMESDWLEYKALKENAEGGVENYYKTTATFNKNYKHTYYDANPTADGIYEDFEKDGIYYYFIVYKYTDNHGTLRTGTTYSQFTANQVDSMGGNIAIAYTTDADGNHYSINTSYNLETCAEYKYYKAEASSAKSASSVIVVVMIVEIGLIALFVFLFIKKMKKYNELIAQDDELLNQKRQAEVEKVQAEVKNKNKFCTYCGCKLKEDSLVCPSCGARLSK